MRSSHSSPGPFPLTIRHISDISPIRHCAHKTIVIVNQARFGAHDYGGYAYCILRERFRQCTGRHKKGLSGRLSIVLEVPALP